MVMLNLVLVPSVINTINAPLSYTNTRSVFTHEQRLLQTLETFKTIKEKIPNSYVVAIEGSVLNAEQKEMVERHVDYLFEAGKYVEEVSRACNGPSKGYGEVMQLLSYLRSDHYAGISERCATVTKFGARIKLSDRFTFREPVDGKPVIRIADVGDASVAAFGRRSILTIFYTMPRENVGDFVKALEECCRNERFVAGQVNVENLLYDTWLHDRPFQAVPFIGIEGYCAPNGRYYHL